MGNCNHEPVIHPVLDNNLPVVTCNKCSATVMSLWTTGEKIVLSSEATNEFVVKIGDDLLSQIVFKLSQLNFSQQWLIAARIVNYMFSKHFTISWSVADRKIKEREKASEDESKKPDNKV